MGAGIVAPRLDVLTSPNPTSGTRAEQRHDEWFLATYLSGVAHPGVLIGQGLVAASVVTSYALLLRRHLSRQHSLA